MAGQLIADFAMPTIVHLEGPDPSIMDAGQGGAYGLSVQSVQGRHPVVIVGVF